MKIICSEFAKQVLESIIRNSNICSQDKLMSTHDQLYFLGESVKFEIENKKGE